MKEVQVNDRGDPKARSDFARYIVSNLSDQIKSADTKAFGTLGLIGIVTAALISRIAAIKNATGFNVEWMVLFGISALLIILALKGVIRVVYPRTAKPTNTSFLYFRDIIENDKEDYVRKGYDLHSDETIKQVYSDAYNLAQITNSKYKALREGMIVTLLAVIWTIGLLIFS